MSCLGAKIEQFGLRKSVLSSGECRRAGRECISRVQDGTFMSDSLTEHCEELKGLEGIPGHLVRMHRARVGKETPCKKPTVLACKKTKQEEDSLQFPSEQRHKMSFCSTRFWKTCNMLQCRRHLCAITRTRRMPKSRLHICLMVFVFVMFFLTQLFFFIHYKSLPRRAFLAENKMASVVEAFWQENIKNSVLSNLSLNSVATQRKLPPTQATGLRNTAGARPYNSTRHRRAIQFRYIINEADKCRDGHPFLIFLVPSEPSLIQARQVIRQTWGNESLVPGIRIVRIFLLGITTQPESKLQQDIFEESRQYHDIVQHEYLDTYKNLTIKTLMGLNWVATFCPNTPYVMKADCDMFVNTEYLIHHLLKPDQPPRHMYYTGLLMDVEPKRDNSSKWYMPPEIYPDRRYPTFCSGTGYVFSGDLAAKIFDVSFSVKQLHLEDVYVALCLKALNVIPEAPPRKSDFNYWRIPFSICYYSRIITSHGFQPDELLKHWTIFQQGKSNCLSSE